MSCCEGNASLCECIPAGTVVGQILVWNGTAWVPSTAPLQANYGFGAVSINAASTSFLYPWNAPTTAVSANTLVISGQLTVLFDGVLRRFFVRHGNPTGANTMTYTLMRNGVATDVVIAMGSATALGSDLISSVAVVAGDSLAVQVNNSGVLLGLRTTWDMMLTA